MESRTSTLRIPASLPSVALLGAADSFLKIIEQAFPSVEFLVRGNQIMLTGESPEMAMAERLLAELVLIIRSGQALSDEAVTRSIKMLREESHEKPAQVLSLNILSNRGRPSGQRLSIKSTTSMPSIRTLLFSELVQRVLARLI